VAFSGEKEWEMVNGGPVRRRWRRRRLLLGGKNNLS